MNAQLTRFHIDQILSYLMPSVSFINCHMVDFITSNLWERFVPVEVRNDIITVEDMQSASKCFFGCKGKAFSHLREFIAVSENKRLENLEGVLLSESQLLDVMGICSKRTSETLNIKEFMNEKKNHEVSIISRLVADIVSHMDEAGSSDVYILDAGDGKGYLSSRLAMQYNLKVLGIDASEMNTESSQKRMQKLERAWSGLKERTEIISQGLTPPRRSKKSRSKLMAEKSGTTTTYKSINKYITKDTNFCAILKEHFEVKSEFVLCLTGLHTCGNLAPACLEAFANNPSIKLLCNVGCCYHLLSEMYNTDNFANTDLSTRGNVDGFPMSNYLKQKQVQLGRNARMLASQSIHRTQIKNELDTKPLFYRALLQVIIREKYPNLPKTPQVGKVKNFSNFKEYLVRCEEKCRLNLDQLESSYVDALLEKHAKMEPLLSLFYLIRMSYAQVIEALILLDRLLFLKEIGIEKSYLTRLFDPVTSPRCYGIIAIR